jgi:hypothetical protein
LLVISQDKKGLGLGEVEQVAGLCDEVGFLKPIGRDLLKINSYYNFYSRIKAIVKIYR